MRKTEQATKTFCDTCDKPSMRSCKMCYSDVCDVCCVMDSQGYGTYFFYCQQCWAIGEPFRAEMHRLDLMREEQETKWRVACEKPKEGAACTE